jgi:hypothetical protein
MDFGLDSAATGGVNAKYPRPLLRNWPSDRDLTVEIHFATVDGLVGRRAPQLWYLSVLL